MLHRALEAIRRHWIARQAAKAAWAKLNLRIHEVDPLFCPRCGEAMRAIALRVRADDPSSQIPPLARVAGHNAEEGS